MQKDEKIRTVFVFLLILDCILSISLVTLSNLTYAQKIQDLHQKTLEELSKHTPPSQNAHIIVGKVPSAVGIDSGKVYVANHDDGTVSVIDATNNAKIKDIKVGKGPSAIAIGANSSMKTLYVANKDDGTVSVINETNNTKITDIKVGKGPSIVGVDPLTNILYITNTLDNTISVINETNNTKITDIKVGKGPLAIGIDPFRHTLYVANFADNTISVINETNNTKITDIKVGKGPSAVAIGVIPINKSYVANFVDNTISVINETNNTKITDIKVGKGPKIVGVDPYRYTLYVANTRDNTISVINETNNIKIKDIKVGNASSAIGIDSGKVYVTNHDDGTVSVINETNNTKITDIKVGKGPSIVGFAPTNTVYVANKDDNTVSVIDEKANKLVAGVKFNVEPFNAGHIECDNKKLIAPLSQQFYLWSGSECTARPNQGFDFVSWQENLKGNSTQMLNVSSPPSLFDPILDLHLHPILDFLHLNFVLDTLHLRPDRPESTLGITKFGNFTANFRALPPAIPPEYIATLFGIVATVFIGSWLTPTIIGRRNAKKQESRLDYYLNEIKNLHDNKKLDKNDIEKLNNLTNSIEDDYVRSKITKEQYDKLGHEVSDRYREIFTEEVNSLNILSQDYKLKLSEIITNINNAYARRRINNEYYISLKEEISVLLKKKIDSLNKVPDDDKVKLLKIIKDELSDGFKRND